MLFRSAFSDSTTNESQNCRSKLSDFSVAASLKDDVESIHKLIIELAVYEREPEAVKTTPQQLAEDGFGPNPVFHVFVVDRINKDSTRSLSLLYPLMAHISTAFTDYTLVSLCLGGEKSVVGMALYFFQYSTWEGKVLYLEDLYITPDCRGAGLGKKLLVTLAQEAKDNNCKRYQWQVLFWNEPSIKFYLATGAKEQSDWRIYRMNAEQIDDFLLASAAPAK